MGSAVMRLILLHGWGASGNDLEPVGQTLKELLNLQPDAVVLRSLAAPDPHPAGAGALQWYNMHQPGWPEIPQAAAALGERLEQELMAAGGDPLVVLGFSQGAAMALEVATAMPVAAVLAFSGYPHPNWYPQPNQPLAPIFLAHGSKDTVVPLSAHQVVLERLRVAGAAPDCFVFKGDHSIPFEAIAAAANFLKGRFELLEP
jgi:phospholipase/carboxylesterase